MKPKKEIAILFFLIVVLGFYISSQNSDKTHYELPEVKEIAKDEITKISIRKKGSEIVLVQDGGNWLVSDEKYPADRSLVDKMINTISGLALTALASESKNYAIYELDEKGRVEVEAYMGDKPARKVTAGKNTPTQQQTFVMINDDHRVYHSKGPIRRDLDLTVSDLRDKKVMSFNDEISEIVLRKGDETMTIVSAAAPVSVDVTEKKGEEAEPEPAMPKWTDPDNKPLNDAEIDGLVDALSNYLCDEFIEDKTKEDFVSPVFTATLKGLNKSYELSFYEKKDGRFPAISSESQYPFLISEWKANKVMKDFKSLLPGKN
jgi:hypothetical protein